MPGIKMGVLVNDLKSGKTCCDNYNDRDEKDKDSPQILTAIIPQECPPHL